MSFQSGTSYAMSSHLEDPTFSVGQGAQILCSLTQQFKVSYTLLYFPSAYMSLALQNI